MSYLWIVILMLAVDVASTASVNRGLQEKDSSAPLLTPSYGLLTETDRNKDRRSGIPFLPTPGRQYFYWQCLNLQSVRLDCTGVMRASSGMGCRRNQCIPEVKIFSDDAAYTFMTHQVWCVEDYRDFKATINHLLHGEKVACFGGEYLDEEQPKENEGKRSSFWFLKRIKTGRGKWDYFPEE